MIRYFDQSAEQTREENLARFEAKYAALAEQAARFESSEISESTSKELLRTKSFIGAQIGLFWRESLWEQLDAKGKYENTLYALKNFFLVHALLKPVVIELEDGHWLDADSLALLDLLTRGVTVYPFCLLTTLRYHDDGAKSLFPLQTIPRLEIDLNTLSADDVQSCAKVELKGMISAELHALLMERTKGNPFYVQQMALYFVENHIVEQREDVWQVVAAAIKLPESIHALLIARIDRLSWHVKELIKVAAGAWTKIRRAAALRGLKTGRAGSDQGS